MVWQYEDSTKIVNTYVIDENGQRVWIPDILSNSFPGMTEVTILEEMKAQGWTASFGCNSTSYRYNPPAGWMCDPSVSETVDPNLGTHGGCTNCVMYHLGVKVMPEYEEVVQQFLHPKSNNNIIMLGVGAIILGMLMFKK